MGMIANIRARRAAGKGFLAWIDRGGLRRVVDFALDVAATVREARGKPPSPAIEVAHDYLDEPDDGSRGS